MTGVELRKFRKKFGLSRENFAGLIKISIHTLDSWEGGKRNIPDSKADLIELRLSELMPMNLKIIEGELVGKKNKNVTFSEPSIKYNLESQTKTPQTSGVPYYDVDFTAGFLEVENNQSIKPDSYISHPFFRGCDYVVRASGQSMAKVITHGDAIGLIKVENWKEFFPFGEIYAIVTNDGFRMVKVITKGESKDTYTLISKPTDNKKDEFPPQQIKIKSILSIFKVQASSHLF